MCSIENKINSELLKSSKSDEEKKDEISGAGLHNIPIVSKEDIIKALKDVGVTPGSIVLIHSSLKSFGYVSVIKPTSEGDFSLSQFLYAFAK
ncbi:MAG: hypothetical protein GYA02_01930, partial [Clostridiaceae bacterium]|nr:hypothetical protein [Clostridiaceae bacterium]